MPQCLFRCEVDFQKFKNINVSGFVISEALEYVSRAFGVWNDLGGPGPRGPEISRPRFTIFRPRLTISRENSRVGKEDLNGDDATAICSRRNT